MLFTFPGSPTIYYGDEAGMEGFEDPLNRGTYPWGHENRELKNHFAQLGMLRRKSSVLQKGRICWIYALGPILSYARVEDKRYMVTVLNAGPKPQHIELPIQEPMTDRITGSIYLPRNGKLPLDLPPRTGLLLQ